MADDYSIFLNKLPSKTYFSRRFPDTVRIATKVVDQRRRYATLREGSELVLRETNGGRVQLVARFYEEDWRPFALTIERWNVEKDAPFGRINFSLRHDEVPRFLAFLRSIEEVHFSGPDSKQIADEMAPTEADLSAMYALDKELFASIVETKVTHRDVRAIAFRKQQLELFEMLLEDGQAMQAAAEKHSGSVEAVWQAFFERNQWIFGYGLSYIFATGLDTRKLEQTVVGSSISARGKRADAILKSQALLKTLCFVEIKRHNTPLLRQDEYRAGVWAPSAELSGAIAQLQETVRASVEFIGERWESADRTGFPTGEEVFNIEPRSFVVAGSLDQFVNDAGTSLPRFRSFEMFRRNLTRPEIITFDELFHRAKFITAQNDPT